MNYPTLSSFLSEQVGASVQRHGFPLSSEGKIYLTGMLERFVDAHTLFTEYDFHGQRVFGLKPITWQQADLVTREKIFGKKEILRRLAEQCLFLVGYCYEQIRQHGIGQVQYHCGLGSAAFENLSTVVRSPVFPEVADLFWDYGIVIGDLHLPELRQNQARFKRVLDQWMETHDQRYELLIEGVLGEKGLVFERENKGGIN